MLLQNLDDEEAVLIVANTFDHGSILNEVNYNPSFNPLDKHVEAVEKVEKSYEALLKRRTGEDRIVSSHLRVFPHRNSN